jgi:hypothetical protein
VATRLDSGDKALEWLLVRDLRISARAQRDHAKPGAQTLIESIAANFDPNKFGTLTVSERDGTYWVVDGGHRRTSLKVMGYEDQKVQCWTYHGLTEEQEAELFLDLNNVRPVNAMDKFKVAVVAGREPEVAIDKLVRSLGLAVGTGRTGTIRCSNALLRVHDNGGLKVLDTTLQIVRDAYGDPGFGSKVVEGIGLFVATYEGVFDVDRLASKLSRKLGGVNGLLGRAEQIKSSHGVALAPGIAAATVETYNQGRGGGKLPTWWAAVEAKAKEDAG